MASQGTWDRVLERLLAAAEAAGMIDWSVSGGLNDHSRAPPLIEHFWVQIRNPQLAD